MDAGVQAARGMVSAILKNKASGRRGYGLRLPLFLSEISAIIGSVPERQTGFSF